MDEERVNSVWLLNPSHDPHTRRREMSFNDVWWKVMYEIRLRSDLLIGIVLNGRGGSGGRCKGETLGEVGGEGC